MQNQKIYAHLEAICLIGYGSIGKGALPLIKKHFTFDTFTVIDPVQAPDEAQEVNYVQEALSSDNYEEILDKIFEKKTGFCVNLSIGTSSADLIKYCQRNNILYIDTVKEEWKGFYQNQRLGIEKRTNYALRDQLLTGVRKESLKTTAISCCGANPGMVSWFVKQALMNIAKDTNHEIKEEPQTREEWARLMMDLGVKGIHVAERDTQKSKKTRPPKAFWNTWSVDGFISEGFYQPAELGWGVHEKWIPPNAKSYDYGCQSAIYLDQPGMNTMVKSWCPTFGPQFGFLITHDEAISISDYYTVKVDDKVVFRPTCHYAYHPCQDAINSSMECLGSGTPLKDWTILESEITEGFDELGVLLYGHSKNAYWYGSQLGIEKAREISKNQNATGLQVSSAVIAGMVYAIENPSEGLKEPDEMDYKRCLEIQRPYIEPVNGFYTEWTPLKNQANEFGKENFDLEDPWQFKNIIFHK